MKKFVFDCLVITAANEAQAKGYRAQVAALTGVLAPRILVVPDPGGRRVGSLGSTTAVLKKLGPIGRRRILICHSGGDSKRLPAYAALGKAFVPVPQPDGTRPSLFERIVANMARLRLPRSGVLVVCGDVAPLFDFAACDFSAPGVTGVAYFDSPAEGSRHGVYVAAKDGRVTDFLQKPSREAARKAQALVRGRVAVDTGILWLDAPTAGRLARAGWKTGDLYEAFTRALVAGFAPFHVNVVPRCRFFHIGSSRELLAQLGAKGVWLDGVDVPRDQMKLGGRNIVTFVPRSYGPIVLKRGECLTCLPVKGKWIPIRYRVDDDFKTDGKWEALKLGDRMKAVDHRALLALRETESAVVTVELPLRIDLAGGWSDTPPICQEQGGCVLNMAVALDGVKPVKVTVRRLAAHEVRVESSDLGCCGVLKTLRAIRAPKDPHDWCALVKSALTVTRFDFSAGGLDIRISADVPKGSGLGTSSILGAALVTALERLAGRSTAWSRVSALTLALEQEMATGGGWQDQIGGLLPGLKLIETTAGAAQRPVVKRVPSAIAKRFAAFLEERALLYFTGRKRMARNILHGVLKFYRENPDGIAREIIRRLKGDARRAFTAIRRGDDAAFCAALNDYWLSKKALDPGSTNPLVELIIARMAPWIAAVSLCGAGGGGFMFVIARSRAAKARIRATLEKHPPIHAGRFYDFTLIDD